MHPHYANHQYLFAVEDADPRLNTDAKFSAGDANALAAFCLALFGFWLSASVAVLLVSRASRWSRLLSLRFAWFCMVLGWSLAVSAVLCGFMYFALVSAALAAFGLVLYGFGLVSLPFVKLCVVLGLSRRRFQFGLGLR